MTSTWYELSELCGIACEFDKCADRWAVLLLDGSQKIIKLDHLKMPAGILWTFERILNEKLCTTVQNQEAWFWRFQPNKGRKNVFPLGQP